MMLEFRLPEDTLFFVFEYDYRFWPQGEDPDSADNYNVRLDALLRERKRLTSPNEMSNQPEQQTGSTDGQASSSASGAYRL